MKVINKPVKTSKPVISNQANNTPDLDKTSLSKSMIWREMRQYYQNLGPDAWQKDIVPYQITSNKLLAHVYANIISSSIYQDEFKLKNNINQNNSLETYYIIELGAGHGKFSFYVCKYLENFLQQYDLSTKVKIIYIASDICDKNIKSWQNHPQLQKYIANGQIDFAKFNAETDDSIYLINSKSKIEKKSLTNNLFVIANYVFDSLSHDAFKCENNQLFATYIDLTTKSRNKKSFSFHDISYQYTYELIKENYYHKDLFNQILVNYKQQLTNGSFLFPIGALNAIEKIKAFSNKNTIFLVADKGNKELADFNDLGDPSIALHGSISFMVNFHAIKNFVTLLGGVEYVGLNSYTDLQIGCFIVANNESIAVDVKEIHFFDFLFKQVLNDVNPQNLISLCYNDQGINSWHNLDQIISVLIISKWDPDLFYDCSQQLLKFLEKSMKKNQFNVEQERALLYGLQLVSECFFKLELNQDVPFALANIYYALEEFETALRFFKISIKEFGQNVETLYNVALCHDALDNKTLAIKYAEKALKNNFKYLAAQKLLDELRGG